MYSRLSWLLGAWLFGVGQLQAQPSPAADAPKAEAPQEKTADQPSDKKDSANGSPMKPVVELSSNVACPHGYQFWVQVEYLAWWAKNAPLPVPIVTTGDPSVGFDPSGVNTVNTAGAIGQPGTQVLLGGGSLKYPPLSGARLTVGSWAHWDQRLGFESSGFIFARVSNRFSAASDSAGSPPLYFPIFSGIADAERGIPIADPLRSFSGDVSTRSTLELWGTEGNVMCEFYCTPCLNFALLVGFRYADLEESLQIHNTTTDFLFNNTMILNDSFQTRNQFYGGQIGGRFVVQRDWLSLTVTGKVALGSAHQTVNVQGDITQIGPNPLDPPGLGTFPGGLYTQSSNIGQRNANPISVPFVVLPSLELKFGCQLTQRLRAFTGYDFLYWNQVLRPGNQIDRRVNLSQNAVLDPTGVGTLVGPAQPAPLFNRTNFWAQGINFGLELTY